MNILLNILKVLGILQASYGSFIGLTRTLKTSNGTLTKDGVKARNLIIIGSIISILSFVIDANRPKDNLSAMLEYPLEDFQAIGSFDMSPMFFNYKNDYLQSKLKIFSEMNKGQNIEMKNKTLNVLEDNHSKEPSLSVKFDSVGFPRYIVIPQDVFEKAPGNKLPALELKLVGTKVFFTLDKDDLLANRLIDFENSKFDLVYETHNPNVEEILYDTKENEISVSVSYKLSLIKNNGKIKTLKDLEEAVCVKETGGVEYFNELRSVQKGYVLTAEKLGYIYNSKEIPITKDDELIKFTNEKSFRPKYYLVKYKSDALK
jgi:hypothetical protein